MATPFVADLGRAARGAPRAALAVPRSLLSRRRILAAIALGACIAAAYLLWFRHSSLVAVQEVDVAGVSFSEPQIRAALTEAGEGMSTLEPDVGELERAIRSFPTVASISVEADFPHRLAIEVTERAPVAVVGAGEGVAVAGDGTVLSGVETGELELPAIEARGVPASGTLRGVGLAQAEVLGAAPDPLRSAIRGIGVDGGHGVEVALAGEVELRFGDSRDAAAKWAAAAAILADPKLAHLTYVDLRLPGRPAVGGAPAPATDAETEADIVAPAPDPVAQVPTPAAPTGTTPSVPPATDAAVDPPPAPAPVDPATGVAGATPAP